MHKLGKEILAAVLMTAAIGGCTARTTPQSEPEKDVIQERIDQMTLQQKVEQMLVIAIRGWNGEARFTMVNDPVKKYFASHTIGGFIAFAENLESNDQTADFVEDMQEAAVQNSGIPLLMAADQEGGTVYRLSQGVGGTGNMPLCAAGDPSYAEQMALLTGKELSAAGFNTDFAPVLDINSNPSNPIIGVRSFSDDAQTAAQYGVSFIKGLHNAGILTSLKHFPGHGDTATDSHTGLPLINASLEELEQRELIPFAAGIQAGAEMIMTAHIQYPNIETGTYTSILDGQEISLPATLSHTILTGILREKMGFDGVICTDAMNMDAIAQHFDPKDSARLAILAGVDLLLMPVLVESEEGLSNLDAFVESIVSMVNDKTIPESRINESVYRILTMKQKAGILDIKYDAARRTQLHESAASIGSIEHQEEARAIGDKAVTVLMNDNDILPIKGDAYQNVLMIGMRADHPASMNYAMKQLKAEGVVSPAVQAESMSLQYGDNTQNCLNAIPGRDLVIITSNLYSPSQLNLSASESMRGTVQCIEQAKAYGIPVVMISSGQPYDAVLFQNADAIVCIYDPVGMRNVDAEGNPAGTYGVMLPCAFDIIFGRCAATGRLPLSLPDIVNGAYTDTVRYSRGSGLTTTVN